MYLIGSSLLGLFRVNWDLERTRTNNKLNPHLMPSPGIKPWPHRWEACMGDKCSTTAPSLLSISFHNKVANHFAKFETSHRTNISPADVHLVAMKPFCWQGNATTVSQGW